MDDLPAEIFIAILSYVDPDDLFKVMRLSRKFNSAIAKYWNRMRRKTMGVLYVWRIQGVDNYIITVKSDIKNRPNVIHLYKIKNKLIFTERGEQFRTIIDEVAGCSVERTVIDNNDGRSWIRRVLYALNNGLHTDIFKWIDKQTHTFQIVDTQKLSIFMNYEPGYNTIGFFSFACRDFKPGICHYIEEDPETRYEASMEMVEKDSMIYKFRTDYLEGEDYGRRREVTVKYNLSNSDECFFGVLKKISRQWNFRKLVFNALNPEYFTRCHDILVASGTKAVQLCTIGPEFPYSFQLAQDLGTQLQFRRLDRKHCEMEPYLHLMNGHCLDAYDSCVDLSTFLTAAEVVLNNPANLSFEWAIQIREEADFLVEFQKYDIDELDQTEVNRNYRVIRQCDQKEIFLSLSKRPGPCGHVARLWVL